ncbi:hypothetical protein LXT21_11820 [Myxococcus sp. K38C18041901]|uniref:hypothetical protein n=1 Tax=Myxococcus guangdongensis TaxID=2906760 RepID=UPI0020A7896D|nr:hypothetical protein [Myxococcus guangdongensis]MCP3059464.1 hypothetical protein [Myxococcus guangdongensis]
MLWQITATQEAGGINITYDLEWLHRVMIASANSMVPFTRFSLGADLDNRSYPRSYSPGFVLGRGKPVDTSSKGGGRQRLGNEGDLYALLALFEEGCADLPVPLSDIAILSKRAVCQAVLDTFTQKGKTFHVEGGTLLPMERGPGWQIHGYPMLCILGNESQAFPSKLNNQGQWRIIQCVFGARLTRAIRARGIGIEVVSREGFGSVFPTLADIPNGIRLDPGLLPPTLGAEAINEALDFTGDFITAMLKVIPKVVPSKKPPIIKLIESLEGYGDAQLAALDRLMSALHALTNRPNGATAANFADLLGTYNGGAVDCSWTFVNAQVAYDLRDVLPRVQAPKKKRKKEPKDTGYGSESEYEDDEPDLKPSKKPSKGDGDKAVEVNGRLVLKKATLISGMAALRSATMFGMLYSNWLFAEGGAKGESMPILSWAPYFELDHEELYASLDKKTGTRVLVFDGAPNPINIVKTPFVSQRELGAIIIDTTNNTTRERAEYLALFQGFLATSKTSQAGGLLILVESASKHPTGGDLVHGIMRVCGTARSVKTFFDGLLKPQLNFESKEGKKARDLNVLSDNETHFRRMLLEHRLLMRNRDLFNTGIDFDRPNLKLPGSLSLGGPPEVIKPPSQVVVVPVLPRVHDVPLLSHHNRGKVQRQVLPQPSPRVIDFPLKKKPLVSGSQQSGSPLGGGDVEDDVESKRKEYEALGRFSSSPSALPKLDDEGTYYEEDDIYCLQRYYLQNHPHVAVLPGISRVQWLQMDRSAYSTVVHGAITTATTIIVQPLHRHRNHWALLYITLGAPNLLGRRKAKLLYIDPLNPDDVPVEDLQLLNLPFPGIEVESCTVRYQDDRDGNETLAQDSCGAWAVQLAVHLVEHDGALPAPPDNRRTAALNLRQDHMTVIAEAKAMDLPQAPDDLSLHVGAPSPMLRRSNSLGNLSSVSRSKPLSTKKPYHEL